MALPCPVAALPGMAGAMALPCPQAALACPLAAPIPLCPLTHGTGSLPRVWQRLWLARWLLLVAPATIMPFGSLLTRQLLAKKRVLLL